MYVSVYIMDNDKYDFHNSFLRIWAVFFWTQASVAHLEDNTNVNKWDLYRFQRHQLTLGRMSFMR